MLEGKSGRVTVFWQLLELQNLVKIALFRLGPFVRILLCTQRSFFRAVTSSKTYGERIKYF
jgi:hypothetical protein